MTSRITSGMLTRSVLTDLQNSQARLSKTFEMASSGMRITRPSDDPFGTVRGIDLRDELSRIDQYQRNVQDGKGWQGAADAGLQGIADVIQRARVLLIAAGNDAGGQVSRDAAASEIEQLIKAVKSTANSQYGGVPVFAGSSTTPPYAIEGSDAYQGNNGVVTRAISDGVDIKVNVDLAGTVTGSGGGDGKLIDTLRTIVLHLKGGTAADANALRTTDLKAMDRQLEALSAVRAEVGASGNRLSSASDRLKQLTGSVDDQRSMVEEADTATTMIAYATQQAAYQASLKAGASIVQMSLLDFLR